MPGAVISGLYLPSKVGPIDEKNARLSNLSAAGEPIKPITGFIGDECNESRTRFVVEVARDTTMTGNDLNLSVLG